MKDRRPREKEREKGYVRENARKNEKRACGVGIVEGDCRRLRMSHQADVFTFHPPQGARWQSNNHNRSIWPLFTRLRMDERKETFPIKGTVIRRRIFVAIYSTHVGHKNKSKKKKYIIYYLSKTYTCKIISDFL